MTDLKDVSFVSGLVSSIEGGPDHSESKRRLCTYCGYEPPYNTAGDAILETRPICPRPICGWKNGKDSVLTPLTESELSELNEIIERERDAKAQDI